MKKGGDIAQSPCIKSSEDLIWAEKAVGPDRGVFTSYALNKSDDHPSISLKKRCESFFSDCFILIFDN